MRTVLGSTVALLLSGLSFLVPVAPAQNSGPSPSAIFVRVHSSVVVIFAMDEHGERSVQGSGFIVDRNKVATNHHVVESMTQAYVIFSDGDIKTVTGVVADSAEQDLTVLSVETGPRPTLALGDELALREGDSVYALGAPRGLELSLTNGIVSSFRNSKGQFLIQTTAPISHGSSGGPLFDSAGRVVGVTTSMVSDTPGIYFSIGIGDLKRLLRTPALIVLPFEEWSREQNKKTSASSNDAKPTPDNDATKIEDLLRKKEFDKAKAALLTFAASNPDSPVVHRLTGEFFLRTGDTDAAIRELSLSIQGDANDSISHFYYAIALFEERRFREATDQEEISNRLAPTPSDQPVLAVLYYAIGDFKKAEAAARVGVSNDASNEQALEVLAAITYHGFSSRKENLSQFVEKLTQISPDEFWVQVSRGIDAYRARPGDALTAFQAAEKDDFPDSTPYLYSARIYIVTGDIGQANDQVNAGLRSVPGDMQLLNEGVFVSLLGRNNAEAKRRFDEVERLYPNTGTTLFTGCLYYYGIGQATTALPYCAQAVNKFRYDHTAYSNYGWAALDANQFQLAFQQFTKAYDLAAPTWKILTAVQVVDLLWGFTLSAYYSGDKSQAHKLLQEIRKDYPTAATVTGLQQMPLLWSATTMQRIEGLIAEFPR